MRDLTKPKRSKEKHNLVFPIILIVITIILIVFAAKMLTQTKKINQLKYPDKSVSENYKNQKRQKTNSALLEYQGTRKKLIEGLNSYWLGTANPKITIVEFADFACPYCKASAPKLRLISIKYKNDVKLIFRNRPAFDNSINLAMAGLCAGEQKHFWEMHDKLFENQSTNFGLNDQDIISVANTIPGLNQKQFKNCLVNKKYLNNIKKDLIDSQDLKVAGTPYFFINGQPLSGDQPLQVWEEIIKKFIH